MAKFRRSNVRHGRRSSKAVLPRIIILFCFCIVLVLFGARYLAPFFEHDIETDDSLDIQRYFLPYNSKGQLIHHKHYSLSYDESKEQAEWVAYNLTSENLRKPRVKLKRYFKPDYNVTTRSAFHRDYTNSGYTRGHLAPAADMSFSDEAFEECYYMSNITPQLRAFNNGIWRELEENIREWVREDKEYIIVTGPVFKENNPQKIGQNRVAVPDYFYKIILDIYGGHHKAAAFYMPHEKSELHLSNYLVSIDEIEEKTGLNFFEGVLDDWEQKNLESQIEADNWDFNEKKFRKRILEWNNQK